MVGRGGGARGARRWGRPSGAFRSVRPDDRVRLLALWLPVLLVEVTLDLVRALGQHSEAARRLSLAAVPTDLLVHGGALGLWLVVFARTPSGRRRRVRNVVFHTAVTAYLLFTVATHLFYVRSGSLLDASTLATALAAPAVVGDLVRRSTGPLHLLLLVLAVAYGVAGPALVARVARATRRRRSRAADTGPDPAAFPARFQLGTAGGAVAALTLGAAFPLAAGAGAYARNNGVEILLSSYGYAQQASAAARTVPAPRTPATLVRTTPGSTAAAHATRPRNVVVVVLESVRWSATSLADPDLGTTPFLADLAERSTVARQAYTVVPHTSKALTAIHCGIAPPLDTRLTESEPGRIPTPCLPELLGRQGYATAFLQSATREFERRPDLVANLGFDHFAGAEDLPTEGFGRANYFGFEDDVLLRPAADWMRAQQQPFLLTLLTVAGHHDYTLPDTFASHRYSEDEELNRYLNAVAYTDRFVSRVFGVLDELGLADDTVVALTGDHGEGFGEHGLRQHDQTIYDEGVRVPFLLHDPSDPRGRTVDTPVTTASTPATVLDALGLRVEGGLPGPAALSAARAEPLYLSCQGEQRCLSRIDGTTKYVGHLGNRPDEVFDLAADPGERHDLSATFSRRELQATRADLLRWRAEVRATWSPP